MSHFANELPDLHQAQFDKILAKVRAQQGDYDALIKVAQMYAVGKPYFDRSYPQHALHIYQMAAKKGHGDAWYYLALCYEQGQPYLLSANPERAHYCLQQARACGSALGIYHLGQYLEFGATTGEADYVAAFALYREAAKLGLSDAILRVGECLEMGNPYLNYARPRAAYRFFCRAMHVGNALAKRRVIECLRIGHPYCEHSEKLADILSGKKPLCG